MRKKILGNAFLVLLVFFSVSIHGAIPADERAALIALYNSTKGDSWIYNTGWKTPPLHTDGFAMQGTEEAWYGITVSGDHVAKVDLRGNQLGGSIPSKLGNLSNLEYLYLHGNQIKGIITPALGNLSNLKELSLYNNQLRGSIPLELGNLSNLIHLDLCSNELSGSIPPELGNLSNLDSLLLSNNQLTGSIPTELGNLSNLIDLHLRFNQLTGNIPTELGNLSNLIFLDLCSNQLTGNIPTEFGNLSNLSLLFLSSNKLSGVIPTSLADLTGLSHPAVEIGYNCLYTTDPELREWLNNVDPGWETHQNECGFILVVQSSPDTGITITVSPNDNYDQGNGTTEFFRTYDIDTVVTLTAPASYSGKNFAKWLIDGGENTSRTIHVTMIKNHTAKAVYQSVTYTLTVQSSPDPEVGITISPYDNNGNGDGNTNFTRTFDSGTEVTLTAPLTFNGSEFIKWTVDSNYYTDRTILLTMDSDYTTVVFYSPPPKISVSRNSLNLGYIIGSNNLPGEAFTINNSGGGTLNWVGSTEMQRINLSPVSGANYGEVNVSIDPVGLIPGKFRGVIYVSDPLASNSPVQVEINLWIKVPSESSPPFGEFSTPLDNSTVYGSIPVTGWVLGDTGVESVKIYREEGSNLVYIGDAVLVEGARPDVEAAYPDYPMNYKAGWGYMMLTNFLPNGGNGTFKIHAIATDKEGRTTTLDIKTIHVDNANAVKPFGAIDTPTQGGTASGSQFINWGWVLTPQPNSIPIEGSTINVIVDGVSIGHPNYNNFRADIANLFPGYANSNGAVGYFYLDTTVYENGVHTIQWTATDSAGNTDGIGSRYFIIENTGSSRQRSLVKEELSSIPVDHFEPIRVKKGYDENRHPKEIYPDEEGTIYIEIRELERLEIHLDDHQAKIEFEEKRKDNSKFIIQNSKLCAGYLVIDDELRRLPIGTTFDIGTGTFYWQPGAGFFGEYHFVFFKKKFNGEVMKENVLVKILPKYEENRTSK